ncbi:unnamed protein product [Prorocentrum cordatum]|uniref:MIF4G domain-containing protein n=1 Tax=Prorocentrum cordatum TaxID=2364126 RepID=A0ABN9T6E7_9DINO|nr:unnamed protein product [Polarella glacialis]
MFMHSHCSSMKAVSGRSFISPGSRPADCWPGRMTEQWGYGQQMMGMQAGGAQMMAMPAGSQQMMMQGGGGQYVVCMMPMQYVAGQGGVQGQQYAFQQEGGMQQVWMQPQMPLQAASAGGAVSAAGGRQGASFRPSAQPAQGSGAAASGGKEFDPSAASFVPAAQMQQHAQQEAVGGSPGSFQMSAGATAFVLPAETRAQQGMASGRYQGGSAAAAGWGLQHPQGSAGQAQFAAIPAPRPNAADARGWTRTPQAAAPAPIFRKAEADAAPADAGSPLHKSTDGKAYVPPHLRNRPAPTGTPDGARKEDPRQYAAKKEEPKKKEEEEEPKALAAAEFPSLMSAVTPKKGGWPAAKKGGMAAKEEVAEAAQPEEKPEEKEEPVLKGSAWGKSAAKQREEAAKKRREEEEARAAQEAAARAAAELEQPALPKAGEPSRAPARPAEAAGPAGLLPSADAQPAEAAPQEAAAVAAAEEARPEHGDAARAGEVAAEAARAPEAEARRRAAEAKGDGKGVELAAEEAANADTNDEGGETTNDEASRPETDVSVPDTGAESPCKEEAKAEEATFAEPPPAEAAPAEEPAAADEAAAGAALGGIFASKGKKKLKNLAAPRPAAGDGAAQAAEEAAERARLEEEAAARERRRAEEAAAERLREEEEAKERARAQEAKDLERDDEDRETEEGTEDMEAATDEVEAASADAEAASEEGEEHASPHAELLAFRACGGAAGPPEEVATLSAKEDPTGWRPEDTPSGASKATTWRRSAEDGRRGDRDRDRKGGGKSSGKDWERAPRETLSALSNKAEHAYKRNTAELDREAELTRLAKSLLNKICPDNCSVIASRIMTEAMVKTEDELKIVIHLIFQKALTEPHYCETYVELVHALKGEMPEFPNPDGGKPLTFKAALLNVTQEEYESMTANTMQPTDEEKATKDPEELQFIMAGKKKKLLANMKFIGHLYLKELLGGKVISSVASELLKIDGSGLPEEHVVECVCELISAIGYTLENSKFQSTLVQVCSRLKDLKGQKNKAGKDILSKRIQFQIQDLLDMRGQGWAKKTFKAAAKTKEEIRADAEREERMKEKGKDVPTAEYVIAGKKSSSAVSGPAVESGDWDVVRTKSRR